MEEFNRVTLTALTVPHADINIVKRTLRSILLGLQKGFENIDEPGFGCRYRFSIRYVGSKVFEEMDPSYLKFGNANKVRRVFFMKRFGHILIDTSVSISERNLDAKVLIERFYGVASETVDLVVKIGRRHGFDIDPARYSEALSASRVASLDVLEDS